MKCVKTGCHLYLQNRGVFVYGDLFVPFTAASPLLFDMASPIDEVVHTHLVMRTCAESENPTGLFPALHVIAQRDDHWWDRSPKMIGLNGTLFLSQLSARWLGYEGVPPSKVNYRG